MSDEDSELKGDTGISYRLTVDQKALDLRLNFNPLMISYCLLLRALADQTSAYE